MNRNRPLFILVLTLFVIISIGVLAQELTEDQISTLELLEARGLSVLPLEDVTESAPQILDLEATSARLNFVGTIPLACTILFGETQGFGLASIDPNMDGAAIIEHNPLMLDLKPDTEYFYRVQGSAEDGAFYVSEIGTFHTPPASDQVSDNLLSPDRDATVTGISSNFGGQPNDGNWGILKAFDDNTNTAWATNGDGDEAFFEVTLGQPSHITGIGFQTRIMSDGTSQIFEFTVTTDSGEVYGPFEVPDPDAVYQYDVDFQASSLRFDVVSSSGGNTGATEIAVYGEPLE